MPPKDDVPRVPVIELIELIGVIGVIGVIGDIPGMRRYPPSFGVPRSPSHGLGGNGV